MGISESTGIGGLAENAMLWEAVVLEPKEHILFGNHRN